MQRKHQAFREVIALESSWNRDYVRKVLRDNLNAGRAQRPFLVTSGEENQRQVVEAYLDSYRVPHFPFTDSDRPRGWQCFVGVVPEDGFQTIEGLPPDGEPPEFLEPIPGG